MGRENGTPCKFHFDVKLYFTSFLRKEGFDEDQISIYLSGLKNMCIGMPFQFAGWALIEHLGLVRHGNIEEFWQPEMKAVEPSEEFKKFLEEAPDVWSLTNEAARKVVINLFLHEAVTQISTIDEEGKRVYPVKFWCDLCIQRNDVQGRIDYVAAKRASSPVNPYFVVVEAKTQWPDEGYCQLLAEMYAVMMENGKNQTIFGALTNETLWQFYKLDSDLKWHQSDLFVRTQKTSEILGILTAMLQK